jgi:hypothetical protein
MVSGAACLGRSDESRTCERQGHARKKESLNRACANRNPNLIVNATTRLDPLMFAIFALALSAQTRYDLLLKGGHVIDPGNNIDAVLDVAIGAGKIARVAANIRQPKRSKWDVRGPLSHRARRYSRSCVRRHGMKGAYSGDSPGCTRTATCRSGVTTAVDAGRGWRNFADFKDRVTTARERGCLP